MSICLLLYCCVLCILVFCCFYYIWALCFVIIYNNTVCCVFMFCILLYFTCVLSTVTRVPSGYCNFVCVDHLLVLYIFNCSFVVYPNYFSILRFYCLVFPFVMIHVCIFFCNLKSAPPCNDNFILICNYCNYYCILF